MTETVGYLRSFAQFPFALRRFLHSPLTLEEARGIIRRRMERREENFLRLVQRSVYGQAKSPYLALLKHAGCEFGDLRVQVESKGLEGALRELRQASVYVTFEEFKGRAPIVRNGLTIPTTARDFDNPFARRDFALQTGGSTGLASAVYQDLDNIAAGGAHHMLLLDSWGVTDMPMMQWMDILPGGGLRFLLQRAYCQLYAERWFAPRGWMESKYWLKYGGATLYMIWVMRMMGVRIPLPDVPGSDQPLEVARAIRDRLDAGQGCILYSSVSRALRTCLAATRAGFDLSGATLRVGGEPITAAKVAAMQRAGVRILPSYGAIDAGAIGLACTNPAHTDDVHACKDAYGLFTHPHEVGNGVTVPALNLTSLLDTTSKIMLNYQSDDYATVEERTCGCPIEACGYTEHLHHIRSYSKLVGEAVTLIGNELLPILEQHLPARFGGSPLDYQMMEQEDGGGFTRLYLVIAPRVPIADEQEVVDFMLNTLKESSPAGDSAGRVWQKSQTLQVRRSEPVWTDRGKLMPLHLQRNGRNS